MNIWTLLTYKLIFVSCCTDGSDSRDKPKLYRLQLSVTEVGTEKFDDNSIQVWKKADSLILQYWSGVCCVMCHYGALIKHAVNMLQSLKGKILL